MSFVKPGPNKRVCAFFIDSIIAQICGVVLVSLFKVKAAWIVWVILILSKDCFKGQSPGKYLVGIQVINDDSSPALPLKTIIRNIFMVIPLFPIIEYIRMLRDKDEGKRIGDNVAKTKVNDLKPELKDSVFLWISIAVVIFVLVIQICAVFFSIMYSKSHPELLQKLRGTWQL